MKELDFYTWRTHIFTVNDVDMDHLFNSGMFSKDNVRLTHFPVCECVSDLIKYRDSLEESPYEKILMRVQLKGLCGTIGAVLVDPDPSHTDILRVEICLAPGYFGAGYGEEILNAVIDALLQLPKCKTVVFAPAQCDHKGIRIAEKCDMTRVGYPIDKLVDRVTHEYYFCRTFCVSNLLVR